MRRSGPTILAFDTSAAHCAAAVLKDGDIASERMEPMERGQAERLMPMLEEVLAEARVTWSDLDCVAVGVGPGSFTGVRIAVAAARGLALALGVPSIGVSMFEVMRGSGDRGETIEVVSLPAPREMAYLQEFRGGAAQDAPTLADPADPAAHVASPRVDTVLGHRAAELARVFRATAEEAVIADIGPRIARIAASRLNAADAARRPVPLYIRPADAAPPREAPPAILP